MDPPACGISRARTPGGARGHRGAFAIAAVARRPTRPHRAIPAQIYHRVYHRCRIMSLVGEKMNPLKSLSPPARFAKCADSSARRARTAEFANFAGKFTRTRTLRKFRRLCNCDVARCATALRCAAPGSATPLSSPSARVNLRAHVRVVNPADCATVMWPDVRAPCDAQRWGARGR